MIDWLIETKFRGQLFQCSWLCNTKYERDKPSTSNQNELKSYVGRVMFPRAYTCLQSICWHGWFKHRRVEYRVFAIWVSNLVLDSWQNSFQIFTRQIERPISSSLNTSRRKSKGFEQVSPNLNPVLDSLIEWIFPLNQLARSGMGEGQQLPKPTSARGERV